MMKLYADEDFNYLAVKTLKEMGYDVKTTQEAGKAGQGIDDQAQLSYASSEGRAILTHNHKDFYKLHTHNVHSGIISCTHNKDYQQLALRIDERIRNVLQLDNQLIRVTRPKS
jgi:predicted nuclease of predicted toxin-antitoxin system